MKKIVAIHPLLFALYPPLALFSHNIALLSADQIVRPVVIIALSVLLSFSLLSVIFKNDKKAGLLISLFVLWFFSYGHIYRFFDGLIRNAPSAVTGCNVSKHWVFFISAAVIFLIGAYRILRVHGSIDRLTKVLNVVSASLVIMCIVQISAFKIQSGALRYRETEPGNIIAKGAGSASYPNIYYIILDAYAREDVLREVYGYDNKDFIQYLTAKGFYVADRSRANYCQTVLSFASSLNMKYLDDLVLEIGAENPDHEYAAKMLKDSFVFKFLKEHGYTTITFDAGGGWKPAMIKKVDRFYSNFKDQELSDFEESDLSFFEKTLMNNTPASLVLNTLRKKRIQHGFLGDAYDFHRSKILYSFDKIEEVSKEKGPLFVFCYFLLPHQPFVFGENGEAVKTDVEEFTIWCWDPQFRKNFKNNYKRQLTFTNKRVRRMIDGILANSRRPPIIILQADHGPELMLDRENPNNTNLKERMSIVSAYYLPGYSDLGLYPAITPVNTFRVIFNNYFGTYYDLLEDKSCFSTWSKPYAFIDVTDQSNK